MTGQLVVLGSCGAWPEPGRACSGFVPEHDGFRVVLDLGYGTLPRLLEHLGPPVADGIDAVIITHQHPDDMVGAALKLGERDGFLAAEASGSDVAALTSDEVRDLLDRARR